MRRFRPPATAGMRGRNDVQPFVRCMLRILLACYLDLESRIEGWGRADSTAYAVVRAYVLSRVGRFRSADVMEACPSAGRSAALASLRRLVEEGVLRREGGERLSPSQPPTFSNAHFMAIVPGIGAEKSVRLFPVIRLADK